MTSALVTEAFEGLQTVLIDSGQQYLEQNDDCKWFQFLLIYIGKYPFEIKLGDISVTKVNALKFIIAFAIARALTYSLGFIAD